MADTISNDNDDAVISPRTPEGHGQAAILLVESLIHGLIARSVIDVADAVEILSVAADVKEELALDSGQPPAALDGPLHILNAIKASLELDLPGDHTAG
jgi:hypothetical protein